MKSKALAFGRVGIGLGISATLGWLVTRGLDWGLVFESLRDISPSIIFLSVVIFLMASFLRAYRWHVLFVDDKVPTLRLFIIQNEGIGLNNVVPIRVVSEATQLAILSIRDKVKSATALATLSMERVIDVIASTFILGLALVLVPQAGQFKLFVLGALGLAIFMVILLRFLAWGGTTIAFMKRFSFVAAFTEAVRNMEKHPGKLVVSLLISIMYWLMVGVTAWFIAVAVNLPISPFTATLVIMGAIFFATAVPAAPSALGTFEFAMISVLRLFGIEDEVSFGFALLTHAVFFLPPMIIAAIFLPREGLEIFSRFRLRLMPARNRTTGETSAII